MNTQDPEKRKMRRALKSLLRSAIEYYPYLRDKTIIEATAALKYRNRNKLGGRKEKKV